MRKLALGLPVLLFLAAGCVSTGKTPAEVSWTPHRDLSYGPHERNLVDLSIPEGAPEGTILFIHGGAWMYGDKKSYPAFLDPFRDRFIVASMSHRYADETTHIDDLVDDVAAAAAFIGDFSARNNRDPGKLIIMGHSSGAHLSMMYAYTRREAGPMPLAFCVTMAGPADPGDIAFFYNFKKMGGEKFFYQLAEKVAGYHVVDGDITPEGYSEKGREVLAAISPISFVNADSPPTIIVHDVADNLVPYANAAVLNRMLDIYGVDHSFLASYSGIGHILGAKQNKDGSVRYDPALASWIVRVMNEYIEKYCR